MVGEVVVSKLRLPIVCVIHALEQAPANKEPQQPPQFVFVGTCGRCELCGCQRPLCEEIMKPQTCRYEAI